MNEHLARSVVTNVGEEYQPFVTSQRLETNVIVGKTSVESILCNVESLI